jgi:hypothetical protein
VAGELRDAKLAVHVVGLSLKPEDAAKMSCLPQTTGGRMFNAQNPDQVAGAIEEALRLASADDGIAATSEQPQAQQPSAVTPAPAGPTPAGRRPVPIPAGSPPGLYLQALLTANGDLVPTPLLWTVFAENRQPEVVLYEARATNPNVALPAGKYIVEAREGPLSVRQTVEVSGQEPTAVNLVLNAGTLRVRAQAEKSGAPLGDAIISIGDLGQGSESRAEAVSATPVGVFKGGPSSSQPAVRAASIFLSTRRACSSQRPIATAAARSRRLSSASWRMIPIPRGDGARLPVRPRGKRTSLCRREPTTPF